MQKYGLLGRKLGHSYSPRIHAALGDYPYALFECEPENLGDFLSKGDFAGLNVTIPYKEAVIPYCSYVDPLAKRIGAVNTLLRREDGLHGYNTDYVGFQAVLRECGQSVRGRRVLILGTGGAAKTVSVLMQDMDAADVVLVGRSTSPNYQELCAYYGFEIIINATPVGMYPNNSGRILDITPFNALEGVYDLVYNPWRTDILLQAKARGISYCNGLPMLVGQAAEAAYLFTGKRMDIHARERFTREMLAANVNITLVGMPGCGKSTIARRLAELSGREFIDIDERIEQNAGMSIADIFKTQGEAAFRRMEKEMLLDFCMHGGRVIATGGGAVLDVENREAISSNSYVVFIGRALQDLAVEGRPLSIAADSLLQMFRQRLPYYKQCADNTINNDTDIETVAERIWGEFCASIGD